MALQNGQESNDLLHSEAHIWNHIFSFINSMSPKCAIELQMPDIINRHGAPMLLSELVEALPVNKERTHFVYRHMRILAHSGFFVKQTLSAFGEEVEREGYLLAPASRLLLKEEPLSIRPYVLAMLDPMLIDPMQHMSKWFQTDDVNPFHMFHSRLLWEFTGQDSKLNEIFNEGMASDAKCVMIIILKQCKGVFEGLNSIVDVGGGIGMIAKAFPKLSCISFDLPHVVNGLVGSNNLSYVGGEMFEAIPKADAVLVKWIMHDWNDEDCIKLFEKIQRSNSKQGRWRESDNQTWCGRMKKRVTLNQLRLKLSLDILMMNLTKGRERDKNDWEKLLFDAGFSDYKITTISELRSLIQVYP